MLAAWNGSSIEVLISLMRQQLVLQQQHMELQSSQIAVLSDCQRAMPKSMDETQNFDASCKPKASMNEAGFFGGPHMHSKSNLFATNYSETLPFDVQKLPAAPPNDQQVAMSNASLRELPNLDPTSMKKATVNESASVEFLREESKLSVTSYAETVPFDMPSEMPKLPIAECSDTSCVSKDSVPEDSGMGEQALPQSRSDSKLTQISYAETLPLSARLPLQVQGDSKVPLANEKPVIAFASPRQLPNSASITVSPEPEGLIQKDLAKENPSRQMHASGDASLQVHASGGDAGRIGGGALMVAALPRPITALSQDSWKHQLALYGHRHGGNNEGRPTTADVLTSALSADAFLVAQAPSQELPAPVAEDLEIPVRDVLKQFSDTSSFLLMLLGVLPARMLRTRRWFYRLHCIGYPVAFAVMLAAQPAIFGRFDMLPWWAQVQYAVFFASSCVVWLFMRRQLQSPSTSVLYALHRVNSDEGHRFSWDLIDWYGRFAMLFSICLAVILYALCSWHVWTELARKSFDVSAADHVFLQISLILFLHPSAVACCFPWLLLIVTQLHCHDLRCFADHVAAMLKSQTFSRPSLARMDDWEKLMVSRLRRSSVTWGCMVALVGSASLAVGGASLLNLILSQPPGPLLAHQVIITALCLLVMPVHLLALLARVAHAFEWEVVPAINSPLAVQAQASFLQTVAHFDTLKSTWGLHIGGTIITTSLVIKFTVGLMLTVTFALLHVALRDV